jgi:hypothetical protein
VDANRLSSFASSPPAFRDALLIPTGRGPARLAAVMAPFQAKDFAALDPAFLALARGEKPARGRFWLERTKGGSKDTDCAVMLLWLLAFGRRALACQVGAADQDQAAELRKAAQDVARLNPWLAGAVRIDKWSLENERTQARCEIIPADVAGSHGARPDLLVLNELTHLRSQDFALNLLDNASKVGSGVVIVATNAGLNPSWQFALREEARSGPRWYFSAFAEPSPWLDPAEVAEARARNPNARFLRLWHGHWVSPSGDALEEADIRASLNLRGPAREREAGLAYFGGIDVGVTQDHAAAVVLGRDRVRRLRLVRLYAWAPPRGGKVDLQSVRDTIANADAAFRPLWYGDPHEAQLMFQELREQHGVFVKDVKFGVADQKDMAGALIQVMQRRELDLWDDPRLLQDLRALAVVEHGAFWKLEAPRTREGHADRAFALVYALLAAYRNPWHAPPADPDATGAVVLLPGRGDPLAEGFPGAGPFLYPGKSRNRSGPLDDDEPPPPRSGFSSW